MGNKTFPDIINAVVKYPEALNEPRMLTQTMSRTEYLMKTGKLFNCEQAFELNSETPLYVLFENSEDSGISVELINRFFQTDSDGADLLILWDYDVTGSTKTALTSFNESNKFTNEASMTVSVLNDITIDTDTGIASVDSAYTPVSSGRVREQSFITSTGVGNNQSGDISPSAGSREYTENTGFLAKITSRGNSNLTIFGYTWGEPDL